jgi:hypothetical protein
MRTTDGSASRTTSATVISLSGRGVGVLVVACVDGGVLVAGGGVAVACWPAGVGVRVAAGVWVSAVVVDACVMGRSSRGEQATPAPTMIAMAASADAG